MNVRRDDQKENARIPNDAREAEQARRGQRVRHRRRRFGRSGGVRPPALSRFDPPDGGAKLEALREPPLANPLTASGAGRAGESAKIRGGRTFRRHAGFSFACFLAVFLVFLACLRAEEFQYDSHGKRDPFVSARDAAWTGAQMGIGELRVEGIILDPAGTSYAVINGEIVAEGARYSAYMLERIAQNEVVFEKDGEIFEVPLTVDLEDLEAASTEK